MEDDRDNAMEVEHSVMRMMLLDAVFTDSPSSAPTAPPSVLLYGLSSRGESIAVHVNDFLPYFWFPAPVHLNERKDAHFSKEDFENVKEHLNQHMQSSLKRTDVSSNQFVAAVSLAYRTPLMYYRHGGPFPYLKVEVWRAKDVLAVAKELTVLANKNELQGHGLIWKDQTAHEEGIKMGMRFFCDTAVAGGSWVEIKQPEPVPDNQQTTRCTKELVALWQNVTGLTPDATKHMEFTEGSLKMPHGAVGMDLKTSIDMISDFHDPGDSDGDDLPDIPSKLGTTRGQPEPKESVGLDAAVGEGLVPDTSDVAWSVISPLRIVSLHVQSAGGGRHLYGETKTGSTAEKLRSSGRVRGRGRGQGRAGQGRADGVASLNSTEKNGNGEELGSEVNDIIVDDIENLRKISNGGSALPSRDPVLVISHIVHFRGLHDGMRQVVFTYGRSLERLPGVEVHVAETESAMLLEWREFFNWELDPDVVCVFQLKDSLRYIAERFKVLKLGPFDIGRCKGKSTEVKSVVTYGKHWVKQQARMTSTSNQEVFRANVEGRLVIDMLRVILVSFNLSTFTLAECTQLFLGVPKEVLSTAAIAMLWAGKYGGFHRLFLYSLREAEIALKLMERLQTVPETVEMARVTGLTLSDVLYKAQMVRVQSLLLRSARREGWLLGGVTLGGQLSESPFLMHPKENQTAGYYQDPIAILDFASLYPSIFMAHNLCYTTLLHPEDASSLPADLVNTSPIGAKFVVSSVRHGVLPRICGALIRARKLARDRMAAVDVGPDERAVLDGRQKALKLCSNALYGFTGAGASPQQALPLADSCLSLGAASCKRAVELVRTSFERAQVIYAQTDSVFVQFQGASIDEAIALGTQAADIVSQAFTSPMVLKFERILCPFLLLQVNRYAGKQYTSSEAGQGQGTLFIKGIEAERRDVPGFVRHICKRALYDILIKNDVAGALENCKNAISQLVAGKWSLYDLLMTGGLWRVDDHDISRLAAVTRSPQKQTSASTAEEGRGPHVALSVRLKRKDPDRQFHIGERIPYVLMANSSKLQDDMAEDPVDAMTGGSLVNTHIYLENKLRKPLESILEHVTDSATLRELFTGSHTIPPPSLASQSGASGKQSLVSRFFRPKTTCLNCRRAMEDDSLALCQECTLAGHGQVVAAGLFLKMSEQEKKLCSAHAECMRCHSGGHFHSILCTNTDCPAFYIRYECPQNLNQIESSLVRLDQQFSPSHSM